MGMEQIMKYDSIIFDLDGTMWDSADAAAVIWKEVAEENPEITDEVTGPKLKSLYGLLLEEIAVNMFKSVSEEVAIKTMQECVIRQNPYLEKDGGILLGDIEGTLIRLSKQYKLAIVSNCKKGYIEAFLAGNGLGKYFVDIECPGNTGMLKADNIKLVMERQGFKAPVYVGDTAGDGRAARKAGIPFIFAAYGFGSAEDYDDVVNSFEELADKLCD